MTDRPIIFSGPMVRALLDGRKTQTRRMAWRAPNYTPRVLAKEILPGDVIDGEFCVPTIWQKVKPGDRLWVRETFRLRLDQDGVPPSQDWWKSGAWYRADDPMLEPSGCGGGAGKLRSPIHMPRWASRLTLTVTETRRERVQEISEADARAEGHPYNSQGQQYDPPEADPWQGYGCYSFSLQWRELHGPGSWDANPEVVVLTFTVEKRNIDG